MNVRTIQAWRHDGMTQSDSLVRERGHGLIQVGDRQVRTRSDGPGCKCEGRYDIVVIPICSPGTASTRGNAAGGKRYARENSSPGNCPGNAAGWPT